MRGARSLIKTRKEFCFYTIYKAAKATKNKAISCFYCPYSYNIRLN
jgi:hypothetical protein